MTDSQTLLADYVQTGSETALRELVARYVDPEHAPNRRSPNGSADSPKV